ncbi:MAG: hypothetical protein AAFO07_16525 [Bacteroidota bacterium]
MRNKMVQLSNDIKASGAQVIALLALNDEGTPAFDRDIAASLAQMDIQAFASTPEAFPELLAAAIENKSLSKIKGVRLKN